ncbi:granulins-like isoform X1, partial [Clarias magur]
GDQELREETVVSGSSRLKMLRLTAGVLLLSLVAGSRCPDQQRCGDEQTCCQIQSGEFNCCPFHQAECCEDHLHCCPEGMSCEVKESRCTNATHSLPWAERFSSGKSDLDKSFRMISSSDANNMDDTVCPDNSFCPAEFSCLKVSNTYGCCPVAQGIACSDGKHCCPNDRECTADSTSCVKKTEPVRAVVCADGTSECPVETSCCEAADGGWGCCPMPRAVCCDDKVHCCPEDSVCDVKSAKCLSSTNQEFPMWAKFPARQRAAWEDHAYSEVPCDDTVACPEGNTCCKDGKGGWGCCPLLQAVCCEDHIHCCSKGKKCNLAAETCEDPSGSVPWLRKEPSRPIGGQKVPENKGSDVQCDDTMSCPDGSTCCKTEEGEWACCPLPEAVCCEDHIHCCPKGKKCNLAAQTCEDPSGSVPWLRNEPSRPIGGQKVSENKGSDVQCDDTMSCPDGSTCCKTEEGEWACCPLPEAVCCEDHIHCCPNGKKCNLAAQTCEDPSGSVPWLRNEPSRPIGGQKVSETKGSDVQCDDTMSCPDGSTCCKTEEGEWACCPLPEAVCCEDHIHCCPKGKKCNLAAQTCEDPSGSVPWLRNEPSRPIGGQKVPETKGSDVQCDDTMSCPDGSTCCKTEEGEWACCPLPEAVCCEDHIHCCPNGKKCNLAAQTCEDPSGSVPWLRKEPSRPIGDKVLKDSPFVVPCNDTVACDDGKTCCKNKQGGWNCCPLPQAVCCEDFVHCCPHGKKCNLVSQSCDAPSESVPWLKSEPSRLISDKNVPKNKGSDVPCDDTMACPDGSTCCKTEQGEWACCPLPQAVCCEDFIHCCPHGKKCNLAAQSCDDPAGSVPWVKKEPSRPTASTARHTAVNVVVQCDHKTSCPDHTTCCFMDKSKKYGCCPLDQATCCLGGENCCPRGYTCRDKWCVKTSWNEFESVPLVSVMDTAIPQSQTYVDCGDGFICNDSETCCRTSASSWGCCPYQK